MQAVYFIGIGGIGMSAIARYFLNTGIFVGGYDKTPSPLTETLEREGAVIHYEDNISLIPAECLQKDECLVIYTPAIPATHTELNYFKEQGFDMQKRAQVLGTLTHSLKGLCAAGTHGKTTTSSMAAHILHQSHVDCNAFLGGITKNYGTNYILSAHSPYVVIEADEFDRSFHWLTPWATVITSTDADHLDIYGTEEAYLESFTKYTSLIMPGGYLIMHTGMKMKANAQEGVTTYYYSREEGDFHAENIKIGNGRITFDLVSPIENITDIELGVPVAINIDNGIAAMALAQVAGVTADEIRAAMLSFGVWIVVSISMYAEIIWCTYPTTPITLRKSSKVFSVLDNYMKVDASEPSSNHTSTPEHETSTRTLPMHFPYWTTWLYATSTPHEKNLFQV